MAGQQGEQCKLESLKFGYNLTVSLSHLLASHQLTDCTLVCSDGALSAHRVVLAANSSFFSSVFSMSSLAATHNPVIFLRNIKLAHMRSIVHFLYSGMANVTEEDVDQFIKVATDLKIEGLMMTKEKKRRKPRKTKKLEEEEEGQEEEEGNNGTIERTVDIDIVERAGAGAGEEESEDAMLERIRRKYAVRPVELGSGMGEEAEVDSSAPPSPSPLVIRGQDPPPAKKARKKSRTPPVWAGQVGVGGAGAESPSQQLHCPMCNSRVASLKIHMDTKHKTECHECNNSFESCNALYEHKRVNCNAKY